MIFIREGTPIGSIDDLKDKEIIIVEDVHAHDWLTKNRVTDSIIKVNEAAIARSYWHPAIIIVPFFLVSMGLTF